MVINFQNNAMFLQSVRQRLRPWVVAAYGLIAFIILALIFSNNSVTAHRYINPQVELFKDVLNFQMVVILGLGSWHAFQFAAFERTHGTLDFHRASPTPALWQMIGLLFGATSLEWLIFLITMPINLVFAFQSPSSLGMGFALQVYASVVLCAVLFHLLAIFFGFLSQGQGQKKFGVSNIVWIVVVFYFSRFAFMFYDPYVGKPHSLFSHLTCSPVVEKVYKKSNENHVGTICDFPAKTVRKHTDARTCAIQGHTFKKTNERPSMFFNMEMNTLLLQFLIQLPLFWFVSRAIMRQLKQPHLPVFSKEQYLLVVIYAFILFLADIYLNYVHPNFNYYSRYIVENRAVHYSGYFFWILFLGILGILLSTPNRLSYLKGLRSSKRLGRPFGALDDHNSNVAWLLGFVLISSVFSMSLQFFKKPGMYYHEIVILAIVLMQIVTTGSLWEAFRLSRWGSKPILFIVGLIVVWVLIPMFDNIFKALSVWSSDGHRSAMPERFSPLYVFSPFFINALGYESYSKWIVYSVNALAAVLSLGWAALIRQNLRKETERVS